MSLNMSFTEYGSDEIMFEFYKFNRLLCGYMYSNGELHIDRRETIFTFDDIQEINREYKKYKKRKRYQE